MMMKMTKREFLKLNALSMAGTIVLPWFAGSCSQGKGKVPLPSWVWYTAGKTEREIHEDLRKLKRAGFEGVHVQGNKKILEVAATIAHKMNLEIHAWMISLMVPAKDIVRQHPDWYMVSREGKSIAEHPPYVGYYKWLCPNKSEVVDFLTQRVEELASIKNLDGVHLDYIRYPDVILPVSLWKKYHIVQDKEYAPYDFCYCDDCRRKFHDQEGVDPLHLPDPAANKAWLQFRYDSVTNLVNHLKKTVERKGKKLSAAVFPTPAIAKKLVRQEWTAWNLDAVFPMMYNSFYEKDIDWLEEATREGENALQRKFPLYSGLYIPAISPEKLSLAVDFAKKGGAQGICLFNYRNMKEKYWENLLVT